MERELGPQVLGLQRAVKSALDPDGILDPGKAVWWAASPGWSRVAARVTGNPLP